MCGLHPLYSTLRAYIIILHQLVQSKTGTKEEPEGVKRGPEIVKGVQKELRYAKLVYIGFMALP